MITRSLNQLKIISAHDPRTFEELYNKAMLDLAKFQPRGTFTINPDSYSAVIEYTRDVKIPEDIRDEFALQGVEYTCSLCPHYTLPEDKRIKKTLCSASGNQVLCRADSPACVWLYEQISRGEVDI